jgi:hypothetical protein
MASRERSPLAVIVHLPVVVVDAKTLNPGDFFANVLFQLSRRLPQPNLRLRLQFYPDWEPMASLPARGVTLPGPLPHSTERPIV